MTSIPLTIGCALIAFSPYLSIFFLIIFKKAQLVIVATTAAFFFLLASTAASITWLIFHSIGFVGPISAIFPGILAQFLCRCSFVHLYHKVESVIQISLQKHNDNEQQQQQQQQVEQSNEQQRQRPRSTRNANGTTTSSENDGGPRTDAGVVGGRNNNDNTNNGSSSSTFTDTARLRLELNDAVSAIAAAGGFGGMHAILLFGTLLARQTSNVGVLYQQSCPYVPSLVVSSCFTFLFSILDVFWMLFTFFGMRRRLLYSRRDAMDGTTTTPSSRNDYYHGVGAYFGNSRNGGNIALLVTLLTHIGASLFTVADYFPRGCTVSIPSVAGIVLLTMYLFWAGCGRIYMPPVPTGSRSYRRPSSTRSNGAAAASLPNIFPSSATTTTNDYHEC